MRRTRATLACAALVAATLTGFASTTPSAGTGVGTSTVMFVGNNWDGTADLVDPATFTTVGKLNVIPDYAQRMAEIQADPVRLAYFLAIRQAVGEGHEQYVDDMFSTTDGRLVAVSRPSFADVVGIDLRSRKIEWRFAMHGQRADHMAISPDGSRLLRQFASGDTPHESNYSSDGARIFHASIGRIYTPTDPSQFCPLTDPTKGDQRFQIVDNQSFEILQSWDIGQKLRDAGFSCMSSAVRPMAISPDENTAYLQISFFHGYVVFDLEHGVVRQVVSLPQSEQSRQTPKSQYVLNSAHHGLAINAAGTELCVSGTMDDYVGLVPIANPGRPTILDLPHVGDRPYWATNGPDASQCWVSVAGDDRVNIYDYASRTQVGSVQVGDHPQRVRVGHVSDAALAAWRSGDSPFVPPAR
jgi:hypothetical protein